MQPFRVKNSTRKREIYTNKDKLNFSILLILIITYDLSISILFVSVLAPYWIGLIYMFQAQFARPLYTIQTIVQTN